MDQAPDLRASGLVYRNLKPHLRSVVAYHPSLVPLAGSELLATFDLGQAVESIDYHTVSARSRNAGESWELGGPVLRDPLPGTTHTIRTACLSHGSIVGVGGLHHRRDPEDRGHTWPSFGRTFDGRQSGLSHLEQSVIQLQDGRILALSWVYDSQRGSTLPTVYSMSSDRGESFTDPKPTGFHAQTCKVIQLQDGRLFCAYRHHNRPGLWGALARLQGDRWTTLVQTRLWLRAESGMEGKTQGGEELSRLQFGYPSMRQISSDHVLLLFWCREDCITNIRWLRIGIPGNSDADYRDSR